MSNEEVKNKFWLNKIYCIDCLDGLKQLDDNSIDLIITSPPYNKVGINGIHEEVNWNKTIDYDGNPNNDNMDEERYQEWQLEILRECYRVLKERGSMFYNHKNRVWRGHGEIISPYAWLLKSPFKIRQEIIWNRKASPDVSPTRFLPTTEKIFWLTKHKSPIFNRDKDSDNKTEVWNISFKTNTAHPAPFPLELVESIIPHIKNASEGKEITILDPFIGSGTTAIGAIKHNCNYIGFEKFRSYVDMARERIDEYQEKQKNI